MYIFDTSAVRAISRKVLKAAAEKVDIAVSTLSVLELASHLNDSDKNEEYSRIRGNFLKCQELKMLDDPFWLLSQHNQTPVNATRQEDRVVLEQLISKVAQSATLGELAEQILTYPDGATASCQQVGRKFSEILHKEEKKYIASVKSLAESLKLDPLLNGSHCLTADKLFETLLYSSKSLSTDSNPNLLAKTFFSTAPYTGYILHRLYLYTNKLPVGESALNIDPNDCEDAYISLTLSLNSEDTLVTGDKGTEAALKGTIALLNEKFPEPFSSNHVMSNEDFLGLVVPEGGAA
ncbi:hypothetical protein [Paraburkholderia sp. BL17N1]|uniref:hypothetical protein n=1 Tax=Paraburkholderia sp. BL17N1 TaxID=1938798 RepID=UPI000F2CAAF5|nr:hypothetical protein [Paraburkholderia sp. BL17N1]RKR31618.1 hypothetical protein B0G82_7824 [Paraburkholderia sp. BL17N1]